MNDGEYQKAIECLAHFAESNPKKIKEITGTFEKHCSLFMAKNSSLTFSQLLPLFGTTFKTDKLIASVMRMEEEDRAKVSTYIVFL